MRNDLQATAPSAEDRATLLEQTRWAQGFQHSDLVRVAAKMLAFKVGVGARLIEEESNEQQMVLVVSGRVDIIKRATDGSSKVLSSATAGHCVGEMSLVDGGVRSASVVAARPSVVLVLRRHDLIQLAEEDAHLAFRVLWRITTLVSRRLRLASGRLVDYL